MNINPSAKRALCFGDSNTWGYISGSDHIRLDVNKRWPGILQEKLGNEWEVIEEGLNSRAIIHEDSRAGKEGRSATSYIIPCLDTHDPLDWVIVMLGGNELKSEYNMSAQEVADSMMSFI